MEAAVTLIVVKPSLYSILWSLAFSLWFLSFSLLFKRKNYWPKSGPLHSHGSGYITHPSLHIQNIGIYIYIYISYYNASFILVTILPPHPLHCSLSSLISFPAPSPCLSQLDSIFFFESFKICVLPTCPTLCWQAAEKLKRSSCPATERGG